MIFSPTCSQAACVAGVEETRLVHLSGLTSALVTLKDLAEDAGKRSLFRTPFFLFQIIWAWPPSSNSAKTRIITFLVGNPYKPSSATVTGKGPHPTYSCSTFFNKKTGTQHCKKRLDHCEFVILKLDPTHLVSHRSIIAT